MKTRRLPDSLWYPVLVLGLAASYFVAARLGLLLQLPGTNASPVWPPSGIGLAAVMLLGLRAWPGIFLGAFLANLLTLPPTPAGLCAASVIAVGNTLEPVTVLLLLRRLVPSLRPFDHPRDLLRFLVTAAIACAVASTIGTTSLWLTGIVGDSLYASVWFTWWLGDSAGILVLTPAIVCWSRVPRLGLSVRQRLELAAIVGTTALTAELTFGGWLPVAVPFIVVTGPLWAAFRFGPRETSLLPVLLSVLTIAHVWQWADRMAGPGGGAVVYVPFVSGANGINNSLLMLQLFVCGVGVTAVVLASAIAEQKQTEGRLRDSELRFRTIFEQAAVGVALIDTRTGQFIRVNKRYGDLIGYSAEEMTRTTFMSLTHPEDLQEDLDQMQRLIVGAIGEFTMKKRLFRKDGSIVWVNLTVSPAWRVGAAPEYHIAIVEDITDRKRVESSLRASERRYRALIQTTTQVVWTAGGKESGVSDWWLELTGQTADEAAGWGWLDAVHADDRDRVRATWTCAYETLNLYDTEYRIRTRAGKYRDFTVRGVALCDPQGALEEWVGTLTDITDRNVAQAALQRSELQYRQLADAMPQIVWTAQPDGHLDYYNERWYEYTALPRAGGGDESWKPVLHPDDVQPCLDAWYAAVESGRPYEIEYRFKNGTTGEYRWHLGRALPVRDDAGRVVRWLGTGTDIHDHKRAEEQLRELNATLERRVAERTAALRESEKRFRAIFHSQFQFIGLMSPDGVVLEANRTALASAGVPEESVIGKPFWETVWWAHDPVQQDRLRVAVRHAASGQQDRFEASHPTPDGTLMWVDFSLTPFRDETGAVVLMIPEGRDISERKRAEVALSESAAFSRGVLDSLSAHIAVVDGIGTVVAVNRAWERFAEDNPTGAGVAARTGVGTDYLAVCARSAARGCEDAETARAGVVRVLAGAGPWTGPEYECHAPAEQRWFSMTVTPLGTANGGAVISHTNISAQKRADANLRVSEELFRSAFDFAPIGIALVAPDGKWLRVNESLCALIGYTAGELLAIDFQTVTHPDDLNADLNLVRQVLDGTLPAYQMEKRYFHKRGHVVHVLLSVSLIRDGSGNPLYFVAHIKDISQRKEAERALAANDALLRQFIRHSPAAIAMFDREVRYVQTSDRWLIDYHLAGRDLSGCSHYDVFPDIPDQWKAAHRRVLAGAVEKCDEDPFPRADGSTEWLQWECRPWHAADGEVGGLIMFTQVITERKLTEGQIKASLREKEVLLKEIHHRVKNNLQIVSALLDLQSKHTTDVNTLAMFKESRGRVRSMALIHERLYRSQDVARVDFAEYIRQLAADLYRAYKVSGDDIALELDVDVPPLGIDIAIPCGLLLNELISNCLKHAFADTTAGRLQVSLKSGANGTNVLTVADNGSGLPKDFDPQNTGSFGMQLVTTLIEQLDGHLKLASDRGAAFTVTFPGTNDGPIPSASGVLP